MPSLPILVLGDSKEDQAEYDGENIAFLPRPILAEQMLNLASHMLAQNQLKTA